jgi:hypothetical protein
MKRTIFVALFLMITAFPLMSFAQDQDPGKNQAETKATAEPAKLYSSYRMDYTWSEFDDGKKINTRTYTVLVGSIHGFGSIRVDSKVPVVTGSTNEVPTQYHPTQYQMMDIGVNIDSRIIDETPNGLKVLTNLDSTSFSQNPDSGDNHNRPPLVHQIKLSSETIVTPTKRTVISTVDDPGSKRSFQLEVIATKEK